MDQSAASEVHPADPTDEELVRRAKMGDRDAFSALYERHLSAVYNRVRYQVPESHVEDVTQEVFITVLRSLKSFQGSAKFSTWLRTVTNRRIADHYRSRSNREESAELETLDRMSASRGDGSGLALDDSILLRRALEEIAEQYREILLLRFAEGLRFQEIADQRGQSLDATYSLFRRAISALRDQIGEIDHA
jgi:RNA polymerase sigma-70 factor (ECF subfamily)